MDLKEMLQAGITGVINQGKASMEGGSCRYRTRDGLKCAIGFIITEQAIELEGGTITRGSVLSAVSESIGRDLVEDEIKVLSWLQQAHDMVGEISPEEDFVRNFITRIKNYGISGKLPRYVLDFEVIANA